ncbi:MAG: lipoprotein-releasing ABC transporter permease subunit [Cellvibrionaceae bacterium]|nr:lipoprotein-releasing ABC transporter permease subunit [Cellvibrionaceae bacterium]
MLKSIPLFIGLRYIGAKRRHQFIAFVSAFSLLGMALGTLALIVVLSVMNGFDREIKQRILSVVPHGFVDQQPQTSDWQALAQQVSQQPQVRASAPYIGGFVMLSSASGVLGAELQAVLPEWEPAVSAIDDYMLSGQLAALQAGSFGIIIGDLLAQYLQVGVGDFLMMTLPEVSITPAGLFPRMKRFQVLGTFQVGAQLDQSLGLIHLTDGQRLFRYGNNVQGLRLAVDDIYQSQRLMADLSAQLQGAFRFTDWSQTQGSLFQAIKLEKRMITLLLMIIIAVAALNIVTSLVLMVTDKQGDIAVLRTLGLSPYQVMAIFMVQGSVVGALGIVVGAVLGCVIALNISGLIRWFEHSLGVYIFDPSVYFISQIPSELRMTDVALVCGTGVLLSLLASLYPAYRASLVQPAAVLRYH